MGESLARTESQKMQGFGNTVNRCDNFLYQCNAQESIMHAAVQITLLYLCRVNYKFRNLLTTFASWDMKELFLK